MEDLKTRLTGLLVNRFGVAEDELREDVTFGELDLDSLTLVEFALAAGRELGIAIGDDDVRPEDTLDQLVAAIEAKSPGSAPAAG